MKKKMKNMIFGLEIIAFEYVALKIAFTEAEYLSSGLNMLINSLKISDTTKTEFFELISFQIDYKKWQKYSLADLSSLSNPLTC